MSAIRVHIHVANMIVNGIRSAKPDASGTRTIMLLPHDGGEGQLPVRISAPVYALLTENESWFRAGAIAPDFFPDMISGMMVSHQPQWAPEGYTIPTGSGTIPLRKGRRLYDFMDAMADSLVDLSDPKHLVFGFGWLTHQCVDIFIHHWVGMEAGAEFESWLGTPLESIRRHLGLEKLMDDLSGESHTEFAFDPGFLRRLMLTKTSRLCRDFYCTNQAGEIGSLVKLVDLAKWHSEKADLSRAEKQRIQGQDFADKCPICKGASKIRETCDKCHGLGEITKVISEHCHVCENGRKNVACSECRGLGEVFESIEECRLCHGSGRIRCVPCGGRGSIHVRFPPPNGSTIPCRACGGRGTVSCPHQLVIVTRPRQCPGCLGQKILSIVCPACKGTTLIARTVKEVCDKLMDVPCVVCGTAKKAALRICDNLYNYHTRRAQLAVALVDRALEAHCGLAKGVLEGNVVTAKSGFEVLAEEAKEFFRTECDFTDLIAPELTDCALDVREYVTSKIADPLKELVPEWFKEMPINIFQSCAKTITDMFGHCLTNQEEEVYREVFRNLGGLDRFPPIRNAYTLFVLSLSDCTADPQGLRLAAGILGDATNLDWRCQPLMLRPYSDPAFAWERYFAPFVDGARSLAFCRLAHYPTAREESRFGVAIPGRRLGPDEFLTDSGAR
jgi:hypothetical protein